MVSPSPQRGQCWVREPKGDFLSIYRAGNGHRRPFRDSNIAFTGGKGWGTVELCGVSNQRQAKDFIVRNRINTAKYEVITGVLSHVVSERGCEWTSSTEGPEMFFAAFVKADGSLE